VRGFIGSHLAERLLQNGNEVFIVDNLWTGKLANISNIQNHEGLHLVIDTILNESVMNELIFKADQIYHLAAAVGFVTSWTIRWRRWIPMSKGPKWC
jgi:UDP-glucose 4-epimerase